MVQKPATEEAEVVVATCNLRAGWAPGVECQEEAGGRHIVQGQSYVQLVCSEGCDLAYHHPVSISCLPASNRKSWRNFGIGA